MKLYIGNDNIIHGTKYVEQLIEWLKFQNKYSETKTLAKNGIWMQNNGDYGNKNISSGKIKNKWSTSVLMMYVQI